MGDKELAKVTELRNKVEAEMTWLKRDEVEVATKSIETFAKEWAEKKEKQAATAGHEEPIFTKAQVEAFAEKSFAEVRRLSKVKKPKERKKKEKKVKKDGRSLQQLEDALT